MLVMTISGPFKANSISFNKWNSYFECVFNSTARHQSECDYDFIPNVSFNMFENRGPAGFYRTK
jgi:hypothetical protein